MVSKSNMMIFTFILVIITAWCCQSVHRNTNQATNSQTKNRAVTAKTDDSEAGESSRREAAVQTEARDLSRYDKAGPYDLKLLARNEPAMRAALREFLWQHWSSHKLGYAVATFYGREGQFNTISYYVEPDVKGVWHIVAIAESTQYNPIVKLEYKAYSIERVKVSKDGSKKYGRLSVNERHPPKLYRILLVGEDQSVKQEI